MTTLLVTYRRPEGGEDALKTFERRYRDEHLAAIAGAPGLRSSRFWRVSGALGTETDLALVAALEFDDRASLDASLGSDEMRAGARILREIAPGLATFLVLDDAPDIGGA
jgi:uncharacterized protein (TIGR02118 family)